MLNIIEQFPIDGDPLSCTPIKSGHINQTFLIETTTGSRYILQKINQYVFPNIDALIHNMSAISLFLSNQNTQNKAMIQYLPDRNGDTFYDDGEGGCWRIYRFVENSICLQRPEEPSDFQECARAFGRFQFALSEFPVSELQETIVHFHDTPDRYRILREVVATDPVHRVKDVEEEIRFAFSREEKACILQKMQEEGTLPIRATHNDTKINNVLLDADTKKAICVIDLDTVMPGLAAFDFGDAIRFGASTAVEDEPQLERIGLDLELYRYFARGFLESCPVFTKEEKESFAYGALSITLECGVRFLTDFLKGDKYFSIDYPTHNLVRARAQFQLAKDMENQFQKMISIVKEEDQIGKRD